MRFMPPRRMARTAMPSMIPRCRCRVKSQHRRCRIWPCASARERASQAVHWFPAPMNFRSLASALCVVACFTSVYAQTSDLTTIARLSGTPDIPGLKMIWLAPWGEVSKAHPWRNIIVHQTEGPAGSARGGAQEQAKNPTRRGVTVWVENDGTVYWAAPENLVPTHGDRANRNHNKYIADGPTLQQVVGSNSIGVEFAGNYPDVTRGATEAQIAAWRILVRVLRSRYGIPVERVYAHNWIDHKDARYCEGCALATLARQWGP